MSSLRDYVHFFDLLSLDDDDKAYDEQALDAYAEVIHQVDEAVAAMSDLDDERDVRATDIEYRK